MKIANKIQSILMLRNYRNSIHRIGAKVTLLGDSHTAQLGTCHLTKNLAVDGETTEGMIHKWHTYRESINKCDVLWIMIGTNDFLQSRFEGLLGRLRTIASLVPSDKPLIWASIPPIENVNPRFIRTANEEIATIMSKRYQGAYLNTYAFLANGNDLPRRVLYQQDGVHLNVKGYQELVYALDVNLQYLASELAW